MGEKRCDVVVIGGGLGGLAAATLLARRGLDVTLVERASGLGGRAATHERKGFLFNEGAHALYRHGAAARVLRRLGVRWSGRRPPTAGLAVIDGRAHGLPATLPSLLTTSAVGWGSKVQGARLFARLGSLDLAEATGTPWSAWIARAVPDAPMRAVIEAFVRVSTYANAPSELCAAAVLSQLRLASAGVDYVDGGWATLVTALSGAATAAGARLHVATRAACAVPAAGGWRVDLDDERVARRAVVLATGPEAARSIIASDALAAWARAALPVRAACLDVALSRLPSSRATFALGVDAPLYLSVHSRTARLAPAGAALVSTMKYLPAGASANAARDPAGDLAELEGWLDLLQPGWRDLLVERRWLPSMVATNALPSARAGGLPGRPGPAVPDAPGVFAVGDWVGGEGMLLDASLASAERAADEIAASLAVQRVA